MRIERVRRAIPGMVLAQDVRTYLGDVFVARGQEVTASLLEKLRNFAATAGKIDEICLIKAQPSEGRGEGGNGRADPAPVVQAATPGGKTLEPEPAAADLDPVTGLPGKAQAESALDALCKTGESCYAVVLVIDNLTSIGVRFGRRAGDELLRSYGNFIAQILSPDDRLFRWSGPALLALLPRVDGMDCVRDNIRAQLERNKFHHTVRTSTRTIPLSASPRWTVLPAMETAALFVEKINAFVGAIAAQE